MKSAIPTSAYTQGKSVPASDASFYRDRTVGLLRRYFRFAIEQGRLPSLLGREFFRTQVTSYNARTFEDAVIFVHDVERCLEALDNLSRTLLARIVLQDYTQGETAALLGCSRRTVVRRFPLALDELTMIFLHRGLLRPFVSVDGKTDCQEIQETCTAATRAKRST